MWLTLAPFIFRRTARGSQPPATGVAKLGLSVATGAASTAATAAVAAAA
jgi:hypothetical protein